MQAEIIAETDAVFADRPGGALTGDALSPGGTDARGRRRRPRRCLDLGRPRAMNALIARYLAARGIAVFALDFRMPPAAGYPRDRHRRHGRHPLAESARRRGRHGCRRASACSAPRAAAISRLLAALRPFDERYAGTPAAGEPDGTVPFVALAWPVSDPAARYRDGRERGPTSKLVAAHHAFWPDEAAMAEGSPFQIVERGDAQRLPDLFIVQGDRDENLTPDMQPRLVDAYRARGGNAEVVFYPGQPHAFVGRDPQRRRRTGRDGAHRRVHSSPSRRVAERAGKDG